MGAGALTYTPAPMRTAPRQSPCTAHDDGGTANSGVDSTVPTSFTITVSAVNDAPTIGAIASQSVNEDDGPQVVPLTTFTAGAADEAGQALTIAATVDHPEYFDAAGQPTIDSAGTLVYTPAVGVYGTATVTADGHRRRRHRERWCRHETVRRSRSRSCRCRRSQATTPIRRPC